MMNGMIYITETLLLDMKSNRCIDDIIFKLESLTEIAKNHKKASLDSKEETTIPKKKEQEEMNNIRIYFDGASKGIPGTTDFGGVLRDEEGKIIFIFHYHLGRATNNMAKLMALEQC